MSKTIIVAGYGPGISNALAERFGQAGFQVALVARSADRLASGVEELAAKGIRSKAFTADLSDPSRVREVVAQVRDELGPIDALAWTAYSGGAGDLLTAEDDEVRAALDIATVSLLAAVREARANLASRKGAVLVANGSLGLFNESVDAMAAQHNIMGLALANAAKHKLVGVLAPKLRGEGIYVGEVMVLGVIKGTAFDRGGPTLEASSIAAKFWEIHSGRSQTYAQVG